MKLRRASDHWAYNLARAATGLWDWIDKRDIDKHVVSLLILYGTWRITEWAMMFAATTSVANKNGVEVGAVIAAVTAPYMVMQAAALSFYFKART